MYFDTGSSRPSLPCSYSIMIATLVIGLVIEAMRKMASVRIGFFSSRSAMPTAFRWIDLAVAGHHRHAASDLALVHKATA